VHEVVGMAVSGQEVVGQAAVGQEIVGQKVVGLVSVQQVDVNHLDVSGPQQHFCATCLLVILSAICDRLRSILRTALISSSASWHDRCRSNFLTSYINFLAKILQK